MRKIFTNLTLFSGLLIASHAQADSSLYIEITKSNPTDDPSFSLTDYTPVTQPVWGNGSGLPGQISTTFNSTLRGAFGSAFEFNAGYNVIESGQSLGNLRINMSNAKCTSNGGPTSFASLVNPGLSYVATYSFDPRGGEGDCVIKLAAQAKPKDWSTITYTVPAANSLSQTAYTPGNTEWEGTGLPAQISGSATAKMDSNPTGSTFNFDVTYALNEGGNSVGQFKTTMSNTTCSVEPTQLNSATFSYTISASPNTSRNPYIDCSVNVSASSAQATEAVVTIRNKTPAK